MILPPFSLVRRRIFDILNLLPLISSCLEFVQSQEKGVSKKAGGIGLQLVKNNKRTFRPNLQRVRVKLPSGQVKRQWVSVKAIKAGKIQKA